MDPGEAEEPDREQLESRVDQLEQTVSKMLPDRRGVLKGLGAAAIGGAAVGGATGGASGQSAAGQVGTESEPVDVEAANVGAQSVSTGQLSGTFPSDLRVIAGGEVVGSIDPSSTSTPVQDADDLAASNGGGRVIFPPRDISEGAEINPNGNVTWEIPGATTDPVSNSACTINFSGSDNGIHIPSADTVRGWCINGPLALVGPGRSSTTGVPMFFEGNLVDFNFDDIIISEWRNQAINAVTNWYQGSIDHIMIYDVDPGDTGSACVEMRTGQSVFIGSMTSYQRNADSGTTVGFIEHVSPGATTISNINVGGETGVPLYIRGSGAELWYGTLNYEVYDATITPRAMVRYDAGVGTTRLPQAHLGGDAVPDYAYSLTSGFGTVRVPRHVGEGNSVTNSGTPLEVTKDRNDPTIVDYASGEVDNTSSNTQPISCLVDFSTV